MKTAEEIKKMFQELPGGIQEQLLDELLSDFELRGQVMKNAKDDLAKEKKRKPCPYCKSEKVYKRGKQKDVQVYQCQSCKKWYSETTGTPLWDIKLKDKWQSYIRCMQQGMPIKKIAKELNISIQTSFDWRHKILSSLSDFAPDQLSGEVECDELELALSNKGSKNLDRKPRKRGSDFKRNQASSEPTVVQVVSSVERGGRKYFKAVETQRLSKADLEKVFSGRLEKDATLITDKHSAYKSYAKHESLKHKTVKAKDHVDKKDKKVHLQHVNRTHAELREFLLPFKGVSSKYLQNYLNWFAYSDKLSGTKTTIKQWIITVLTSWQAYELFWLFKENAVNIRT